MREGLVSVKRERSRRWARPHTPAPAGTPSAFGPRGLLALQRAVGNQAVQRWIQRNCVSWHEGTPQKPPPALPEPKSVQTDWGSVVTLAPGIGIELVGPANDDYVNFIRDQMTTMSATETGAQMLSSFGPGKPGRTPATSGPYQGSSVLIAPPPHLTGKFAKPPEIKTEDVGPRAGDRGARVHSGPKLPRIQFFELKDQAQG